MAKHIVKDFLDKNHVNYSVIQHTPAYTAPEIAANCHISGKYLAKVVIIKVDDKFAMVVEPAHQRVNLKSLKELLKGSKIELASESEFQDKFPDCEVGAVPPFGNLYDMDVYVSEKLTKDDQIAFSGGKHTELIKMSYKDFEKLVHPNILKH
ncbi:MAG: YbaK/EbsC family protein [Gammaproteobacteria bacterium]|nr:YbaK/EbsC family protein [Gammaproteobacteria bacterium]